MAILRWMRATRFGLPMAALLCLLPAPHAAAQRVGQTARQTIAVLDFDLLDDQKATVPDTTLGPRLAAIRSQLAEALARENLYTVVDNAPARTLIDTSRATQDLHDCNGCELAIGKALGADRVMVGWVQKVSNLILNINLQIEDVATGRVILNKSVDLRGNTDESWRRGIAYLVRDMVEKHQGSR
ncbi:MAG: DUF3280 domain-containing protein [Burkholderiaceae bacterium]